jgi:hypothetical protein
MTTQLLPGTTGTTARPTRARLACLAISGPLFAAVSLTQALTRDGFALTRHPLSMLSTGSLGWLQITLFLVTGALILIGAGGLGRALRGAPGGTWAARLLAVTGIGLLAAGPLRLDPADGFPAGTPLGQPDSYSWHAYAHNAVSSIAFIALIAACFVLGRYFSRTGDRVSAVLSRMVGTVFTVGNAWAISGGRAGALTVAIGALSAMLWVSLTAFRLRRRLSAAGAPDGR